jgi:putative spermidine/putrescine transport system substrate-binding protein
MQLPRVRRDGVRSGRGVLAGLVLAATLAAAVAGCGGGSSGSSDSGEAAAGLTPQKIKQASGTVKVLGWQQYDVPKALNTGSVTTKWTPIATSDEIPLKIKPSGSFDLFTSGSNIMTTLYATNRLAPIDTSLLPNYQGVPARLRDDPAWKGPNGKVYAVPFAVTPGVTGYDANRTAEPKTMNDLLSPSLKGQIGVYDDPVTLLSFAEGLHIGDPAHPERITPAQLNQVSAWLKKFKPQVKTLYQYGGEVQLFSRGDIKVAFPTYGSLVLSSSKNGARVEPSLLGAVSYADALSVVDDAHMPAAYQWMNHALAKPVQEKMATAALTNSVVGQAKGLPGPLNAPLTDILQKAPVVGPIPPLSKPGYKYVSHEDLVKAWNEFKGSF